MNLKQSYLKAKDFLSINKVLIGKTSLGILVGILLYIFVNFFVFERIILDKATGDELNKKYDSAITFYDIAYSYYRFNHFSQDNKEIFFELPYKKAVCYMKMDNVEKATKTMLDGYSVIQRQYGPFSKESAYYAKKYLMAYYLNYHKRKLASQAFNNLFVIYKIIEYRGNDMADMLRLSGDIYLEQGNYSTAIGYYKKAYNYLIKQETIDYEVFEKIVVRITDYQIASNREDLAIKTYISTINMMKNTDKKPKKLIAEMLIKLGNIYAKDKDSTKKAIESYAEATELIKKLPHSNYLKQNITVYLNTLKDLYIKDNQPEKAEAVDKDLARIKNFSFIY